LAQTFQLEETGPGLVSFELVQSLRNVQDQVIAAQASCKGDLQVVQGIWELDNVLTKELSSLPFLSKQLEGFIDSAEVLCSRIRNTIDLVGIARLRH
jgi:hypothetical protein